MKTIIVIVAPDGKTQITAQGFSGNECRSATAAIRDALGATVQEQWTAEYHQTAATAPVQQEHRQ